MKKDLISMNDLSKEEIIKILDSASFMKQIILSGNKKAPHLQGKSIVTLFYENSTRTRMSFELASKYLGAASANISASASSVAKGETLIDTGRTLDMMGTDIIIIRHPMSGAAALLAKNVNASVINAGDGMNEHPTQSLLDIFSLREKMGSLEGLKVAIVGDIYHSRVARSNIIGMSKMGARVVLAAPATLMPPCIEEMGAEIASSADQAVRDADAVMGLRIQKERQQAGLLPSLREYFRYYSLDEERISLAKPDAVIMHPGPMNRGVEISSSVADGGASIINEQVRSGVAVRMALLHLLAHSKERENGINN